MNGKHWRSQFARLWRGPPPVKRSNPSVATKNFTSFIDDPAKPSNLPSYQSIIDQSFEQLPLQTTAINLSGVRLDLKTKSDADVKHIWVKFGGTIQMSGAKTQQFIAQYIETHNITAVRVPRLYLAFTVNGWGFIVSEYIDGQMCDLSVSDVTLVAPAVQALLAIPSPSLAPGPIGGGVIEHPFFDERKSDIEYKTVEELEAHVNGILARAKREERVDLMSEVADHGLLLCISDLKGVNFLKDQEGNVVAVDFASYSFLPPSFFMFALRLNNLAHWVGGMLQYPPAPHANVVALEVAAGLLVQFGTNTLGLPKELRSRLPLGK